MIQVELFFKLTMMSYEHTMTYISLLKARTKMFHTLQIKLQDKIARSNMQFSKFLALYF